MIQARYAEPRDPLVHRVVLPGPPSGRRRPGYGEATSHQGRLQVQTYQDGLSSNLQPPAGLEPAIPGSVGRCLVHWATGLFKMQNLRCSFVKWCLEKTRVDMSAPPHGLHWCEQVLSVTSLGSSTFSGDVDGLAAT